MNKSGGGSQQYSLLSTEEEALSSLENRRLECENSCRKQRPWKTTSLLSLSLNLVLACWILYTHWPTKNAFFPGVLRNTAATARAYMAITDYSSAEGNNTIEIQSLWDDIIGYHGYVAVDHDWAKQQNLLPARVLPSDPSKGIYVIDAYHALHCLKTTRKAFYQLLDKGNETSLDRLPEHYSHCYDVLKQSLTCSAADHLLALSENNQIDDGQMHQCKDWGALRAWAFQHTACIGDMILNELPLDVCHGPDDGIRLVGQ